MSKNHDRLLGHGEEADGIEEYDNPLPDWWMGLFFVTIVWAVVYLADWHVLNPKTQASLYEQEVAEAKLRWPELDKPVGMDASPETLAEGQAVFTQNCVACHGADLHGGIGPNLVDAEWIHGGEFEQVSKTITEGVAAKGMPAWGPILGPKKIAAVAAYVLSKAEATAGATPAPAEASADDGAGDAATP